MVRLALSCLIAAAFVPRTAHAGEHGFTVNFTYLSVRGEYPGATMIVTAADH